MKPFLLSGLFSLCFYTLFAQDPFPQKANFSSGSFWNAPKNVIKTRPIKTIGTIFGPSPIAFNLCYERALSPHLSLALNLEYGLKKNISIPSDYSVPEISTSSIQIKSIGLVPEIRFYPGKKEGAPKGFYLLFDALYRKHTASTDISTSFPYPIDVPGFGSYDYIYNQDLNLNGTISSLGGGFGLGTQWISGSVAIDVLWIGLGANYTTVALNLTGTLIDEVVIEQDVFLNTGILYDIPSSDIPTWLNLTNEFQDDIDQGIGTIPYFGNRLKVSNEAEGIRIAMSTLVPRLRLLNFSIGIAF